MSKKEDIFMKEFLKGAVMGLIIGGLCMIAGGFGAALILEASK
jgi:hypothetical protein